MLGHAVSDDFRAVLAALTPGARDMLRHMLLRDGDKRGAASGLMVLGLEEGDYLLDDIVYAINRQTLNPSERHDIVQMLDEIEAEGSR